MSSTNVQDIAQQASGPWFREFRFRSLLDSRIIDERPELLERALQRAGLDDHHGSVRPSFLQDHPLEEIPSVIDWQDVYRVFSRQKHDLFVFLKQVRVEGRLLTEQERIDGFCSILSNEDWTDSWNDRPFLIASSAEWEYALIAPDATP